uniref:Uncharacterized protein n=1 Tax=Yoonia rhodophyticola TaxID=3137370 RepID=A0AAN0MBA0_9RHOB
MTTFIDGAGVEWQIDYEGCLQILRQWAQARARMTALRVVTDSSDMQEMRFDADKFRRFRERYYDEEGAAFSARLIADGSDGVRMLAAKYEDIPRLQEQAQARFRRVTSHNMHRVNENVTLGENIVTGLQLTRDISGIIFMCCIPAAAASGGLSLGGAMLARLGGSVFQGLAHGRIPAAQLRDWPAPISPLPQACCPFRPVRAGRRRSSFTCITQPIPSCVMRPLRI